LYCLRLCYWLTDYITGQPRLLHLVDELALFLARGPTGLVDLAATGTHRLFRDPAARLDRDALAPGEGHAGLARQGFDEPVVGVAQDALYLVAREYTRLVVLDDGHRVFTRYDPARPFVVPPGGLGVAYQVVVLGHLRDRCLGERL